MVFFFRILSHFYVGSMFLMRRLHLAWSWAFSPDNSLRQVLMLSNHLRFGLPLLLLQVVPDVIQPRYGITVLWCKRTINIYMFGQVKWERATYCSELDQPVTINARYKVRPTIPVRTVSCVCPTFAPSHVSPYPRWSSRDRQIWRNTTLSQTVPPMTGHWRRKMSFI